MRRCLIVVAVPVRHKMTTSKPSHKAPIQQLEALQHSYRSQEACKAPVDYRAANPVLVKGKNIKKQITVTEFWKDMGKWNDI